MIVVLDSGNVLNIKMLTSAYISYTPKITAVENGRNFFGFKKFDKKEVPSFTLTIKYINESDGKNWTYTCSSDNRAGLEKYIRQTVEQLRQHGINIIDKAFEEAFLKG